MNVRVAGFLAVLIGLAYLGVAVVSHAAERESADVNELSLQALFKGKAIVLIGGKRRVLKVGEQSPEGVTLVETNTAEEIATVQIGKKTHSLRLGAVISPFASGGKGSIVLYADTSGHYFTDGQINGITVRFLVDTGATTIAMNSHTAQRIGLDYKKFGKAGYGNTAGGVVRAYSVKFDKVQVGEVVQHGVDGAVIEGTHPTEVLLGMSFLGRMDMKREGEKLEMTVRY
jgi:aspartyl protease family protein